MLVNAHGWPKSVLRVAQGQRLSECAGPPDFLVNIHKLRLKNHRQYQEIENPDISFLDLGQDKEIMIQELSSISGNQYWECLIRMFVSRIIVKIEKGFNISCQDIWIKISCRDQETKIQDFPCSWYVAPGKNYCISKSQVQPQRYLDKSAGQQILSRMIIKRSCVKSSSILPVSNYPQESSAKIIVKNCLRELLSIITANNSRQEFPSRILVKKPRQ